MKYRLDVKFVKKSNHIIYKGESYLRKNLSDMVTISERMIRIQFSRKKKIDAVACLNSHNSLIRYQLQKAICFYLITQGSLPRVSGVEFYEEDKRVDVEHTCFSKFMENCNVDVTLPADKAAVIFSDRKYAKDLYITITYLIKAQLDQFSNDCYRSAWTGINSVYRMYDNGGSEGKQIQNFSKKIRNTELDLVESEKYVRDLDYDFWKNIDWYHVVITAKKVNTYIDANHYKDSLLLGYFIKKFSTIGNEDVKKEADAAAKRCKRIIENGEIDIRSRISFLICDYCYMIRNRYFHAAKAYPLFVISENAETKQEKILTKLMLILIKEFFVSEEFMS